LKKLLLTSFTLAYIIFASGTNITDSLYVELKLATLDQKLDIYLELAKNYSTNNFDSALLYAHKALDLAEEQNKQAQKGAALKIKGSILIRMGDLDNALLNCNKAINIFTLYNNQTEIAGTYNNIGVIYLYWGENDTAIQYFNKCVEIFTNTNKPELAFPVYINIGTIEFRSGNYKNAENYFIQAQKLAKKTNSFDAFVNATSNLASVYYEWGKYTKALNAYSECLENYKKLEDTYQESITYYNMALVYEEISDYNTAIEYVIKSLELKKEINAKSKIPISLRKLGEIYTQWGKHELALNYYVDALILAREIKDKYEIANALGGMATAYANTEIYDKALDLYNESALLFQEINSNKEIAIIYTNIGTIYSDKFNNYTKANKYFIDAEAKLENTESISTLVYLYDSKADNSFLKGNYTEAIDYIKKSIELMPSNQLQLLNNYNLLAKCYKKQNNLEKAVETYEKVILYKDSVTLEKANLQLARLEIQNELQKKVQEITVLTQQSELNILLLNKKKKMQFLLIITIALLLITIGLVLLFYKKLKKVNSNLLNQQSRIEEQKKDLIQTNKELKHSHVQAERLSNFKSQFLANISHEIRTPLNAISGYTKLLSKSIKTDCDSYYINQVLQATDNMMIIINDLLDFSKIEAGNMVLESIEFNPVKIVTQSISTLKFRAEEKNIKLEIHIDPFIPQFIIGDPHRLSQILTNIISNAIKFSMEGQVVTIEAQCETHDENCTLFFSVTDRGLGIPENKLENIFESFTQVHSDTSRLFKGTGLGLSIVKRLIELQNGDIKVKSKVKEGSEFSFNIPYKVSISNTKNNKTETSSNNTSKTEGIDINILLVEDNLINQELVIDTIESWPEKITVDIADNGKEAILAIQKKEYNVVLMDIQMPIMDGHEATQYIRTSLPEPKCNIPIIGMSAHALSSEKEEAIKNGMNEYIIKPFNPEELKQKIISFVLKEEN